MNRAIITSFKGLVWSVWTVAWIWSAVMVTFAVMAVLLSGCALTGPFPEDGEPQFETNPRDQYLKQGQAGMGVLWQRKF